MARYISQLLGRDPAIFSKLISELENMHGASAIDVRLIGDLTANLTHLHHAVGLDPSDTTTQELYRALRSRVKTSNEHLAEALGGQHPNAVSEMTPLILKAISRLFDRKVWVMKPQSARRILEQHQPLATMKALGYKEISEMLTAESMSELMVLVRYLEDDSWNTKLLESYVQLTPDDFEQRQLEVVYIDRLVLAAPLGRSMKRHRLVLHSKEMGVVAIAPTAEKVINSYTVRTFSLLVHYLSETIAICVLLESAKSAKNYGNYVRDCLQNSLTGHLKIADVDIHYRGVHAYRASNVVSEDISSRTVNDILPRVDKRLAFWDGHAITAKNIDDVVSANIIDLSIDDSEDAAYSDRSLRYMRRDLERELLRRYMHEPSIRRIVLMRLGIDYE